MAAPLTDAEKDQIVRLLGEGHSYAHIAREVRRSVSTIGRVAQTIGHQAGHTNLARAHEARSAYSAERRAQIAARATERIEEVLERMEGQFLVYNFGGKENTYNEHTLPAPPVEAVRAMAQTVRDLTRTVLDIDRHDNKQEEGLAAVDAWLRDVVGSDA